MPVEPPRSCDKVGAQLGKLKRLYTLSISIDDCYETIIVSCSDSFVELLCSCGLLLVDPGFYLLGRPFANPDRLPPCYTSSIRKKLAHKIGEYLLRLSVIQVISHRVWEVGLMDMPVMHDPVHYGGFVVFLYFFWGVWLRTLSKAISLLVWFVWFVSKNRVSSIHISLEH